MLSERANILTLREIGGGVQFSWVPQACIWCKSELKTQGNIFFENRDQCANNCVYYVPTQYYTEKCATLEGPILLYYRRCLGRNLFDRDRRSGAADQMHCQTDR